MATDPAAANDLAAAYYLRAQLEDRPDYLLEAWERARYASATIPAARFNLALIQEQLGLTELAERTWTDYERRDHTAWGNEARRRAAKLRQDRQNAAFTQWPQNRRELPGALNARDRARVARLVAPFPTSAERYLEDIWLGQWALSGLQEDLASAQLLAEEVSVVEQDTFATDVVATIARASGARRTALRRGHKAYAEARQLESAFQRGKAIAPYRKAFRELSIADSPLRHMAKLGFVINDFFEQNDPQAAESQLRDIERAIGDRYPHLAARVVATRAFLLNEASRQTEALEAYDHALQEFDHFGDVDQVNAMLSARADVWQRLGHRQLAWREAILTNATASHVPELRGQHVRYAVLASAALALKHPLLALDYQNAVVDLVRGLLAETPPESALAINGIQHHLSSALRFRAEIKIAISQLEGAQQDLTDAGAIADQENEPENGKRNDLQLLIREVTGKQRLAAGDNEGAVRWFTQALESVTVGQSPGLRVSLLSLRAQAHRNAGRPVEAEADLRQALSELRAEEDIQLARRKPGELEGMWSPYLDRFPDAYRQLIDLAVQKDDDREAFRIAERAKALDPLDRLRSLPFAPKRFRELTADNNPLALTEIQERLPEDTFLFEYCVLDDKTYVWVIGHKLFELISLRAKAADVDAWQESVKNGIEWSPPGHVEAFVRSLVQPYRGLIAEPMDLVRRHYGSGLPRIVIIPDRAMHGLPFPALSPDPLLNHHFVDDAIVSVDGSATLYVFSLMRDAELPHGTPSALLIGGPRFDHNLQEAAGLGDLGFAELEVDDITPYYSPVRPLKNIQATVPSFLRLAKDYDVLHIAGHAIVNEKLPAESLFLLAPSGNDRGKLDVKTLAQLSLPKTRLVTLASCASAGGAPVGPEGVAPLVRPFITAGVPGIVGSLWRIEDATARDLLVSFHRHYREQGEDAAKALRAAQLEVHKNLVTTWAAYEVIGFASAPEPARATSTKEKPP